MAQMVRDIVTGGEVVVSPKELRINGGKGYSASVRAATLANAATLNAAFKTPAAVDVHLIIEGWALVRAHYDLLSAATWDSTSGTAVTIYNRDRGSTNTTGVLGDKTGAFVAGTVVQDVTTLAGTVLESVDLGPGSRQSTTEWILARDTQYAVRLTADAASNAGNLLLIYYEITDRITGT